MTIQQYTVVLFLLHFISKTLTVPHTYTKNRIESYLYVLPLVYEFYSTSYWSLSRLA